MVPGVRGWALGWTPSFSPPAPPQHPSLQLCLAWPSAHQTDGSRGPKLLWAAATSPHGTTVCKTPRSPGRRCPTTSVGVRTHCSSRCPLFRAVQETRAMLLRLPHVPACLRGKEVWGCLRAGCPDHSGRTLPLVPRTLSVPRPVPRCLRSCPTHALVSANPAGGSSPLLPRLQFLQELLFYFACRVSGFLALLLPGQLRPQVGSRWLLFCKSSGE